MVRSSKLSGGTLRLQAGLYLITRRSRRRNCRRRRRCRLCSLLGLLTAAAPRRCPTHRSRRARALRATPRRPAQRSRPLPRALLRARSLRPAGRGAELQEWLPELPRLPPCWPPAQGRALVPLVLLPQLLQPLTPPPLPSPLPQLQLLLLLLLCLLQAHARWIGSVRERRPPASSQVLPVAGCCCRAPGACLPAARARARSGAPAASAKLRLLPPLPATLPWALAPLSLLAQLRCLGPLPRPPRLLLAWRLPRPQHARPAAAQPHTAVRQVAAVAPRPPR